MRPFAVALLAVALAACGEKQPAPKPAAAPARDPLSVTVAPSLKEKLVVAEVGKASVRDALRVSGRIEVDEARVARIGASVTGRITDLDAVLGEQVRRGQVLATMTSTELSSIQLEYLKAYSQRTLAERAAMRARQLFDADVIGAAELQRRQAELVQADAEVSAARDQLAVLGMSERAILQLAATRKVNSQSQIVSSLAGTVIERKVTTGQVVQPADTVYVVADLSSVWLVADVPEQNAGMIRVGEAVAAEVAALPGRRLAGKLTFVAVTVNPETRTVRVRMDLPNPNRELKPAMLATVFIKGAPTEQVVVPAEAVVREENKDYVFVETGGATFALKEVTLGQEFDGKRVVTGGLRPGERVVAEGAFHLNNERKRAELQGS